MRGEQAESTERWKSGKEEQLSCMLEAPGSRLVRQLQSP